MLVTENRSRLYVVFTVARNWPHVSRAECNTVVTTLIFISSYTSFALRPQYVYRAGVTTLAISIFAWAISYRLVYMDTKCVLQRFLIFFVNNLCCIWNPFWSFVFYLHGRLRIAVKSDTFPNFKLGQYSVKRVWSSYFRLFRLITTLEQTYPILHILFLGILYMV